MSVGGAKGFRRSGFPGGINFHMEKKSQLCYTALMIVRAKSDESVAVVYLAVVVVTVVPSFVEVTRSSLFDCGV